MNRANAPLLALLFFCFALWGCDKDQDRAAEPEIEEAPQAAGFEATCTVTQTSQSLGVVVLRDPEQRCTVFIPAPITDTEFSIALRADPEKRSIAAELLNAENERLYATDGEVSLEVNGGRITGQVDARDQNAPAVGRLRIAIDAPMP